MGEIPVALVRFSKGGRTYPVNCRLGSLVPGDRVLVRMKTHAQQLHVVEFTELVSRKAACKNSIVCRESDRHAYGDGPPGVHTADDLDRFLLSTGWRKYPFGEKQAWETTTRDSWTVAYEIGSSRYRPPMESGWLNGSRSIICVGPSSIGRTSLNSDRDRLQFADGKLVGRINLVSPFRELNPYQQAAEWAEDEWLGSTDDRRDTSLHEIRNAVSTTGGSAYLGDDVWL